MPGMIFEKALYRDQETGEVKSYWPERWPVPTLLDELFESGSAFFAASYMNDPSALEGNSLKVKWLHAYTETELQAARKEARVDRGPVWCGLDPSIGGGSTDPDYFGMFSIEVLNNKGYCRDFFFDRLSVDDQGQAVEDWLDTQMPHLAILEEVSSRGYVFKDLTTQVNGGLGSKWPIEVRKPQAARDKGGKKIRFQAMAARFQNGQIKIPGILGKNNQIAIDPRWNAFVNQWRTFPSGHDDILDGCYWAAYEAFVDVVGAGHTKEPGETITVEEARRAHIPIPQGAQELRIPDLDRRGRVRASIGARQGMVRRRWWE
jgi:phage terminase large subunit-like protein